MSHVLMFRDNLSIFYHDDISVNSAYISVSTVSKSFPLQQKLVALTKNIGMIYSHTEQKIIDLNEKQ